MAADGATPWMAQAVRKIPVATPSSGVSLKRTIARRYSLVLKIASGGMGAVYLGFQTGAAGFRRPVAIKRAHAHLAEDPEFRRMIINESRLAALVRHPNVVGVCDVEDVDGELFLVMEYVEGATLAELMASERPLPLRLTLRIIADACRGLDALHEAVDDRGMPLGLVHRDVSPQNILVGIDGVARIADFGIAKAYEGTTSGLLRGKPAYMAPEYITSGLASPASDVFGLGVVAWECIARRRLFRVSNDAETLDRVRHVTIPPASTFEPNLPRSIEDAIFKALARSVSERFKTAREFGAALESVSGDSALFARSEAVGEHVQSIVRDKLELRRQALVEETPAQGRMIDVPAPLPALNDPAEVSDPSASETPLTGHSPVLPPERSGKHVAVVVAVGAALFAALFTFSLLRTTPREQKAPTAGESPQAGPPEPVSSSSAAPQAERAPAAPVLKLNEPARLRAVDSERSREAPLPSPRSDLPRQLPPPSSSTAASPPPPASSAETASPLRPSSVAVPPTAPVAPSSPTSLVGAPPTEAPDNPYR